jgi:hypothetical protein
MLSDSQTGLKKRLDWKERQAIRRPVRREQFAADGSPHAAAGRGNRATAGAGSPVAEFYEAKLQRSLDLCVPKTLSELMM